MSYFRVNRNCNGCLACVQNCPANALSYRDNGDTRTLLHNMSKCARCANCWRVCPNDAVEFQHLMKGAWDEVASMELLRCIVCGEPLYTVDFKGSLSNKVGHELQALCSRHRKSLPLSVWKRLAPVNRETRGAEK